jgi:outer membrane protein assembly factor BamB/tRNA A-37 threonylcarbamoyl transferase component Bud32
MTTRQLASKRGRKNKPNKRSALQPGDVLQQRYRIVGTLGVGGFSSVYQARDMRFQNVTKLCAVKEMIISAPDPQIRELTIKSFERESSMLAMLDHPAIPDVSDYFTEGDRSYLVLDMIRGKDLEVWLEEQTEPIEQELALNWLLQLCNALIHLHSQKPTPIIFRDLKPSNIMLDQYNRMVLIDFGIAKLFETGNKGTMIGTEGYSPPEQYRGQATPAGDIYALGATFHHLFTRQDPRLEPPFTFNERPISVANPNISPAFEAIIMRCLAYDPSERFRDASALKSALELLATPAPVIVEPEPSADGSGMSNDGRQSGPAQVRPLWVFQCEDEIRSKAAVANKLVLVSAYDNNLYALEKSDGELVWKFPASGGLGSSPYVYDNDVFVGSVDNHLYSLKLPTGRMNWRFATEGPVYSSPMVRFDHVFFGSDDGYLYAVNAAQGRSIWRAKAYGAVRSTPFVDQEHVYFGTEGGYIFCLDLSNGTSIWQSQAKRAVTSSPTVCDEVLFVGSMDSTLLALDASSGWTIWRFRARRPIISSAVVHEDTVYVGSSDGHLYALDADSGRQLWSYETEGQVTSSPAVWGESVYFGSTDGGVYSVTQRRGELRWRFETAGPVISSPTIVDGVVYIGSSDRKLYALPA